MRATASQHAAMSTLGGVAISWKSKKQTIVDVVYVVAALAAKEGILIKSMRD